MKLEIDLDQLKNEIVREVIAGLKPLLKEHAGGDRIFGVKELAEYLGQKPSWVYSHIRMIPHTKKGGLLMFKKSCIDKWIDPDYYSVSEDIQFSKRRGVA
ncbi:MAG: helix-turn-helix domain-containing protein [Planctomycetota bacterium]